MDWRINCLSGANNRSPGPCAIDTRHNPLSKSQLESQNSRACDSTVNTQVPKSCGLGPLCIASDPAYCRPEVGFLPGRTQGGQGVYQFFGPALQGAGMGLQDYSLSSPRHLASTRTEGLLARMHA